MYRILALALMIAAVALAQGYRTGELVEDFSLRSTSGKTVSLTSLGDVRGAIVVFTCNHCPYAKKYEDRIIALHDDYAPEGYPVVAINPNDPSQVAEDSFENMIKRAKEKNYPFEYLFDETQEVARRFGATRTPQVFLLQRESDGKFRLAYIGAIDDSPDDPKAVEQEYVRNAISALQTGSKVDPSFTKAVGCTIKWRKK
ncbi:MAG: thioredoxin family protein [Chlorobiota bacterium]|nr:MAG: thioredoxin family protein [Chlorobiota bacterium]